MFDIKLVGKNLDGIRNLYRFLKREIYKEWSEYEKYHKTFEIFGIKGRISSWYNKNVEQDDCTEWHIDGGGHSDYDMVISSYPNTTDILLPLTSKGQKIYEFILKDEEHDLGCETKFSKKSVEKFNQGLYNNDLRIFNPKRGHICYLPPKIIHKTNTKAINKSHLVLRIWNPQIEGIK